VIVTTSKLLELKWLKHLLESHHLITIALMCLQPQEQTIIYSFLLLIVLLTQKREHIFLVKTANQNVFTAEHTVNKINTAHRNDND